MPREVRELRASWPSQVSRIPNLIEELEKDFRFGQRILKTERGYFLGGAIKGGTSSAWYPSTREQYKAYGAWFELEGVIEGRDDEGLDRLRTVLAPTGIQLVTKRRANAKDVDPEPYSGFGPLYRITASVLEALPPAHLRRPELAKLQLGGWGPDGAKASAYDDATATVYMYEFAVRGARRTYHGLLLHELGHVHEVALGRAGRLKPLHDAYKVIGEADAFFGVEFLLDTSTRKLHQKFVFTEFLAETYMIYAACGAALRAWVAEQSRAVVGAWRTVYEVFRETFGGVEYE